VHVAATGLISPNGTVLTPDGRTLIVAETHGARLTAFDVQPDGTLTNQRIWASLPSVWPDGIALDAEGAVWVANAVGPECLRVGEGGAILARVATSDRCFACALGGPDRQTLYLITGPGGGRERAIAQRGGKVETTRVEVPGAGWP
jgi:sugar lactone lactonase YvrE